MKTTAKFGLYIHKSLFQTTASYKYYLSEVEAHWKF